MRSGLLITRGVSKLSCVAVFITLVATAGLARAVTSHAAGPDTPGAATSSQDPQHELKTHWQAYAVDYLYYVERLAQVGKYYETTALNPGRLSHPALRRLLDRKLQEENEIRALLLALEAPPGRDADTLHRDTAKLISYVETLRNVAASRVNGSTGVMPRAAVEAYADFLKDLNDTLRRLRNVSQLDLALNSAPTLTAEADREAVTQWRQVLESYSALVNRLTDAASYYSNAAWEPTRMQTPEARAVMNEEAATRAAISRLNMPAAGDVQRGINQMLGALDELRTTASSGGGTQTSAAKYSEFSVAAVASLDRMRALAEAK